MILRVVNRVVGTAEAVYKAVEDGEVITVPILLSDYQSLALPGAGAPTTSVLPGGKTWKWLFAREMTKFDVGVPQQGDLYKFQGHIFIWDKGDANKTFPMRIPPELNTLTVAGPLVIGTYSDANVTIANGILTQTVVVGGGGT